MKKDRLSVNVDRETRLRVKEARAVLDMSESAFCDMAIQAELDNFEHRKEMVKAQEKSVKHLEDKVKAEEARDSAISELNKLKHEIQAEIDRFAQERANLLEVIKRRKTDRNEALHALDVANRASETFKAKYEESQAELVVVKARLAAYQRQGFFSRVFRRKPKATVPHAEPVEDKRLWETPDKPITPTPKTE